jgi:hypothetical protein
VDWTEVFLVFLVSHAVGDYLLQTDWQALNKRGGLGPNREARRALFSHVFTYTLAYVPALVWIADERGAEWGFIFFPIIFIPHLIQDDGRLLMAYMRSVKQNKGTENPVLVMAVDQSLHMVALFLTALWAAPLT